MIGLHYVDCFDTIVDARPHVRFTHRTRANAVYYTAVVPLVSTHMNSIYNLIAYLTFAFEYLSFYWVSVSDPGRITKENHSNAMSMFPYDFVMFYPRTCRTCLFTKCVLLFLTYMYVVS